MIGGVVLALVILALIIFTAVLLWPDFEREFDADMNRRLAELDADEQRRRSL
ncbi:hypothetical protein [Mycolicibacterium llatzerense]|uniref:hypothetical protein n=1 Tax=Mycolicibacterium llatzerense TaxID=280871 RepID=UPI0021B68415|nr:hypothetical protein [Mycolicibacterium llatzerense]